MIFIFPFPSWVRGAKPELAVREVRERHGGAEEGFPPSLLLFSFS